MKIKQKHFCIIVIFILFETISVLCPAQELNNLKRYEIKKIIRKIASGNFETNSPYAFEKDFYREYWKKLLECYGYGCGIDATEKYEIIRKSRSFFALGTGRTKVAKLKAISRGRFEIIENFHDYVYHLSQDNTERACQNIIQVLHSYDHLNSELKGQVATDLLKFYNLHIYQIRKLAELSLCTTSDSSDSTNIETEGIEVDSLNQIKTDSVNNQLDFNISRQNYIRKEKALRGNLNGLNYKSDSIYFRIKALENDSCIILGECRVAIDIAFLQKYLKARKFKYSGNCF